ncbi:hypothetical protein [Vibrio sp. D431a]|uniref:hypothetical protein n=1 Tax=Vibrio sp. D431a TaxID=2837388 RepID=UPI00255323FE|nr:hypothetical protein [Vibrio sp. D431a]MDK9789976.1 hypothetical protein [Vibrio sp. D431a]
MSVHSISEIRSIIREAHEQLEKKSPMYIKELSRQEPKYVRNAPSLGIDVKKTIASMKRLGKHCVGIRTSGSYTDPIITHIGVTSEAKRFKLINGFLAVSDTDTGKVKGDTWSHVTNVIFTNHAVQRFLQRSDDFKWNASLEVFTKAYFTLEAELLKLKTQGRLTEKKQFRQVRTIDNGIVFFLIENPLASKVSDRVIHAITYISEKMIKDWNEEALHKEWEEMSSNNEFECFEMFEELSEEDIVTLTSMTTAITAEHVDYSIYNTRNW